MDLWVFVKRRKGEGMNGERLSGVLPVASVACDSGGSILGDWSRKEGRGRKGNRLPNRPDFLAGGKKGEICSPFDLLSLRKEGRVDSRQGRLLVRPDLYGRTPDERNHHFVMLILHFAGRGEAQTKGGGG